MKWFTHNSLSEQDMTWLAGTELMSKLQRHRVILVYDVPDEQGNFEKLGLHDDIGPHFMREIDKNTYEFMFSTPEDQQLFQQHLAQYKLSLG